jgi:hypothetical protein
VGNISGAIVAPGATQRMVSHNGTVGHIMGRVTEFTYDVPEGALVILHSDGIATRWSLENYPGLASLDPAVIAGVLYRDWSRGKDDATVVVLRGARP